MRLVSWCALVVVLLLPFWPRLAVAEDGGVPPEQLFDMGIEQLLEIKVVTASKHPENYFSTPAAVYVITHEEMRRAGARNIPEALRLAPGVEVQRINGNQYAIGIRGQTDLFMDKLLVLMDGRPLYSPTFGGTWWPAQNYPLEDVDRIEVIRGSAGAVWGSNAVSGVINILTKSALDTAGGLLSVGVGKEDKGFSTLRYGTEIGGFATRAYVMEERHDGGLLIRNGTDISLPPGQQYGQQAPDARKLTQGGFRLDGDISDRTRLSLHGDSYDVSTGAFGTIANPGGPSNNTFAHTNRYRGRNFMVKVDHQFDDENSLTGQFFADRADTLNIFDTESRTTLDGELQVDSAALPRQRLTVGLNYRYSPSIITGSKVIKIPNQTNRLQALLFNDEINIWTDHLTLSGGFRYERNNYSGWEFQPQLRATVEFSDDYLLWMAASRAVRVPNMIENGMQLDVRSLSGPMVVRAIGDGRANSEHVTSLEMGVRAHPISTLLVQASLFRHLHRGIVDTWTNQAGAYMQNGMLIIPVWFGNYINGNSNGLEMDFAWQPNEIVGLKGTWSRTNVHYNAWPIVDATTIWSAIDMKEQTPHNRYTMSLNLNPTATTEFDLNYYHYDRFRRRQASGEFIVAAYDRLDVRTGWSVTKNFELELVGANLLHGKHVESLSETLESASFVERSWYLKGTFNY